MNNIIQYQQQWQWQQRYSIFNDNSTKPKQKKKNAGIANEIYYVYIIMDRHEFQLRFDTHKLVISIKIATKATPTTAIHIWLSMCCAHLWQYWHHKGDNYRVNMQTTRCNAIDIGFRVCVHVNNRVIMKDLHSVLWYDTFIILLLFLFFLHLFCALYVNSFCPRYFYVSIWRIISLAKKSEFIFFCCFEFHNV